MLLLSSLFILFRYNTCMVFNFIVNWKENEWNAVCYLLFTEYFACYIGMWLVLNWQIDRKKWCNGKLFRILHNIIISQHYLHGNRILHHNNNNNNRLVMGYYRHHMLNITRNVHSISEYDDKAIGGNTFNIVDCAKS